MTSMKAMTGHAMAEGANVIVANTAGRTFSVDLNAPFTTYAREVQRFFAAVPAVLSGPWPDPAGLGRSVRAL